MVLDIAMLSDIDHLKSCTTVPSLSTSDHLGVSLTLTLKSYAVSVVKSRSVWLYKYVDFNRACELIEETDWDSLLSEYVDESTVRWTERYLAIMEQCIPRHSVRRKHNLPWLPTNIVRHIRKRNTMFQKAKRSKKESHYDQFKKLRNTVVSLMRKEKQKYFNNLTGANTKKFWKAVKYLNKNKQSIPTLEQDNVYAVSDVDKADMLNDFFC